MDPELLTPEIIIETEVRYRNLKHVWDQGHFGGGELVPIIDTGVNPDDLPAGAVASQVDLTPDKDNRDYYNHGTLIARFILGLAPKAKIVSFKVFGKSTLPMREDIVRALDACEGLSPRPKFINVSLAIRRKFLWRTICTIDNPCALCGRVNGLYSKGIVTVASAGTVESAKDGFTCPANAVRAVKAPFAGRREATALKRFLKKHLTSLFYGRAAKLLGTSQAAAMLTGGLTVLASAFPSRPALEVLAAFYFTGVNIEAKNVTRLPNFYRAYVLMNHAILRPKVWDMDRSLAIVRKAEELMAQGISSAELMSMMEQALDLDESNYLAYYYYAKALEHLGIEEKAQFLHQKYTELLPPLEALEGLEIVGGLKNYKIL